MNITVIDLLEWLDQIIDVSWDMANLMYQLIGLVLAMLFRMVGTA